MRTEGNNGVVPEVDFTNIDNDKEEERGGTTNSNTVRPTTVERRLNAFLNSHNSCVEVGSDAATVQATDFSRCSILDR